MKFAAISDIHGNAVALQAVLNDIPEDVDTIVCLGDIVGYGPHPEECLELVRERCDIVIQGNHDRVISEGTLSDFRANLMAHDGAVYAQENLSPEQLDWLRELPEKADLSENTLLVHSHPEHTDKYVKPGAFPRMRPYLDEYKALGLGHTHIQHSAVIDDRLIFNPGSVGQPRDNDTKAAYAIVDETSQDIDLRRVKYDIDKVVQDIEDSTITNRVGKRLYKGE